MYFVNLCISSTYVIEIITGNRAAGRLWIFVVQHLQITAQRRLHFLAGNADYIAVRYGLFGYGRRNDIILAYQLSSFCRGVVREVDRLITH